MERRGRVGLDCAVTLAAAEASQGHGGGTAMHSAEVLRDILQDAGLDEPCSAMPLWKYPVSEQHLAHLRREFSALGAVPTKANRERQGALALLVAHLLCEHLGSGAWRWEPVLAALKWTPNQKDMQRLREHLGDGLEFYWKRPVRLVGGDREYLGSLLVEGGLPLSWLTGEGGPGVQQLLQRLVRLVERHRVSAANFVGEHLELLPDTLKGDQHIAELVANMADVLVHLRRQLPAGCESPADYLDVAEPGWRQRLPIPKTRIGRVDHFISRVLATESTVDSEPPLIVLDWRLSVDDDRITRDVVLASRISLTAVARELQQLEDTLPSLMYLCLESSAGARIQLARLERSADGNSYIVVPTGPAPRISDLEEWRATLFANQVQRGEFLPVGGDSLDAGVPWIFDDYDRGSHLLLGCGDCELRTETLIVSMPAAAEVVTGSFGVVEPIPSLHALGRSYCRVLGAVQITADGEAYTVVGAANNAPVATRLRAVGRRLRLGASGTSPLWGLPRVMAESDDVSHDVPVGQLEWRPSTGCGRWRSWCDELVAGDVTIRWRKYGRTWARLQTTVLPADFVALSFRARAEDCLRVSARSLEDVTVVGDFSATVVASGAGEFRISATDVRATSSEFVARLRFSNGCATELRLPLPSAVTGFVEPNGQWLRGAARRSLARSDALRARGAGYAEFQLDARCEGASWETVAIAKAEASGWAEIHLDMVREQLESMLSSTNLDDTVDLRFSPRGRPDPESPRLSLAHYGLSIDYDAQYGEAGDIVGFVCRVCAHDEQAREGMLATQPSLRLISLARPWEPWAPLESVGPNLFRIDVSRQQPGPHLVVAFHGALLQTRPKFVVVPGVVDTTVSAIAVFSSETDYARRAEQWRSLIATMSRDYWHPAWLDTDKLFRKIETLPPSTFELFRFLAEDADACAMSLLRQPTVDHQRVVLRLFAQLGVLPETIPLPSWLRALRRVVDAFKSKPELTEPLGGIGPALRACASASFGAQPSSVLGLVDLLRCMAAPHVSQLPRGAQDYTGQASAGLGRYLRQQWQALLSRHADDQWPQS